MSLEVANLVPKKQLTFILVFIGMVRWRKGRVSHS